MVGNLTSCRAEEERQRQLAAERAAREAEEARKAAEAKEVRQAERRALAELACRFAVRLEGAASIAKPPEVLCSVKAVRVSQNRCRRLPCDGTSRNGWRRWRRKHFEACGVL